MKESIFTHIPCGQTLPLNNIHAVSVSMPELQNVIDEVIDRYGRLPKELENLIDIARIKQLARKANILKIAQRENGIVFYFVKEKIKPEMVNTLITKYPMLVKFSNAVEPYVTLRIKENENIIEKAKEFLNTVIEI